MSARPSESRGTAAYLDRAVEALDLAAAAGEDHRNAVKLLLRQGVPVDGEPGGTTPLSYQWSVGGTNLVDATNSVLVPVLVRLAAEVPAVAHRCAAHHLDRR